MLRSFSDCIPYEVHNSVVHATLLVQLWASTHRFFFPGTKSTPRRARRLRPADSQNSRAHNSVVIDDNGTATPGRRPRARPYWCAQSPGAQRITTNYTDWRELVTWTDQGGLLALFQASQGALTAVARPAQAVGTRSTRHSFSRAKTPTGNSVGLATGLYEVYHRAVTFVAFRRDE